MCYFAATPQKEEYMTGTVYKSTGSWYTVKTGKGDFYECRIKGKFRIQDIKSTNPIAVGDHVHFELEKIGDDTVGIIDRIGDRKNYIIRKSVKLSKQTHIIASNLDLVFLMVTLNNPTTYTIFIDRFLATAEAYDIPVVLLFNKIDSYPDEALDEIKYLASLYRDIGYTCIGISAKTGKNIDQVKSLMADKTSMFAGHSGVGKSTLINALEPTLTLKTAEISNQHLQGQHTTTFAEMYDLTFGARIIDTPGIKGFGIVDMEKSEIGDYFREFFKLKGHCKFNDCLHLEEPGCAVKDALDHNLVSWSRYKSYVQMVSGEDENYRQDSHEEVKE
jgi:ribosome biogenesis GTPase